MTLNGTHRCYIILQMNVIVFAMRQNAGRLQAQHENEQAGCVSSDEEGYLRFVFDGGVMEPPIFLLQIDEG